MVICQCACGARFRVPDEALGKRARCKDCGATFTLQPEDDGTIPLADESWPSGAAPGGARGDFSPPPSGSPASAAMVGPAFAPLSRETARRRNYWSDVLWSFLFPCSPGNLIIFVVLWVVLVIASLLPLIAPATSLLAAMWFAAFRFTIIESAAAGESDLPDLDVTSDFVGELAAPWLRWTASWLVVLLPAVGYLVLAWYTGRMTAAEVTRALVGGISGLWQGATSGEPIFDALLYLGIAFWPMVVLCFALGGMETVYRVDLMVVTIVRSLHAYLTTLALLFVATVAVPVLSEAISAGTAGTSGGAGGGTAGGTFLAFVLTTGVSIYLEIVSMRLIGLYYHHFKDRFAWDWG